MSSAKKEEAGPEGGIPAPFCVSETSAKEHSAFEHVRDKVQLWLRSGQPAPGKEMDSVFFNEERFELLVDTRGYKPEDLKCTVGPNSVQLIAERQEVESGSTRCMSTTRSYQLPKTVVPLQACCCISSEGLLLLAVPWQR